jgi:hypothetical protein
MLVDAVGNLKLESFVTNAQKLGTMVFTFPVQNDNQTRVPFLNSFTEELEFFYFTVGVDGISTDFCKDANHYLDNRIAPQPAPAEEDKLSLADKPKASDPRQLTRPFTLEREH